MWLYQVSAELTPESDSRVAVQFKQFKLLNTISVTAPDSARGWLDTTYLDSQMRISRGDKGKHLAPPLSLPSQSAVHPHASYMHMAQT